MATHPSVAANPLEVCETWLDDMAAKPLPGGVSAAAVAAAMGAALIAKAARVTLRRPQLEASDVKMLAELLERAQAARSQLLDMAAADERAFRAVLVTQRLPAHHAERRQAQYSATEVPIRVAEACAELRHRLSFPFEIFPPNIQADLSIGDSLLKAGEQAGLLAVASNLSVWGDLEADDLRLRWDMLRDKSR